MIKSIEELEELYQNIIKSKEYMSIKLDEKKILIRIPKEDEFKFILFHGTSKYMIDKFSENKTIEFTEKNKMNYEYAFKILNTLNQLLDDKEGPIEKVLANNIINPDRIDYTYSYLCLTTNIGVAKNYATNFRQVGELNSIILSIYNKINNSEKRELLNTISSEYINYIHKLEEAKDSEGIVLFIKNLNYKDICMSESEEKISFNELLKSIFNQRQYNIHYHGENTLDVEVIPLSEVDERYTKYFNDLKKQIEGYRVYPFENLEFETEKLKNRVRLISKYKDLMY